MRTASLLAIALTVASFTARADDDNSCKLQPDAPSLIYDIPGYPSFFAKVSADGRYMFYINNGNHILDLQRAGTRVTVPGPYDPVPAPPIGKDKKVKHFTMPSPDMRFYDLDKAIAAMKPGETVNLDAQPLNEERPRHGSYQSVGVISDSGNGKATYRTIAGSLNFAEFEADGDTVKQVPGKSINCGRQGSYQLPMISKDGREISVYDTSAGSTKILRIQDDGSCKEVLDLGIATGKVEFAYDNNAITFHTDSYTEGSNGRQFSAPGPDGVKNVYAMELKRDGENLSAGNIRRITSNIQSGNNSYYPSFTANGDVAYINSSKAPNEDMKFSFRVAKAPLNEEVHPLATLPAGCETALAATFALGDMMQQVCRAMVNNRTLAGTDAALWTMSLDPKACRNLVQENWDRMESGVKGNQALLRTNRFKPEHLNSLTKDALLDACPTEERAQVPPNVHNFLNTPENIDSMTGKQVFMAKCQSCHEGGTARSFEWDNLKLEDVSMMLISIQDGTMPRGATQNRAQLMQPLIRELLAKQQALEEAAANAKK
ncbi:MAG: hypothetical protein EOP11_07880 [Proteobacteria bacterium]|nr:MAG: hypothetical protein EOP11_07880 [Pseudomonadota bacterium]